MSALWENVDANMLREFSLVSVWLLSLFPNVAIKMSQSHTDAILENEVGLISKSRNDTHVPDYSELHPSWVLLRSLVSIDIAMFIQWVSAGAACPYTRTSQLARVPRLVGCQI